MTMECSAIQRTSVPHALCKAQGPLQKREKKDDGSWRPERPAAKQWFWAWQDCWTQELIVVVAAGHYLDVTKPVWEGGICLTIS